MFPAVDYSYIYPLVRDCVNIHIGCFPNANSHCYFYLDTYRHDDCFANTDIYFNYHAHPNHAET